MEFKIRKNIGTDYLDVQIKHEGIIIDLGFHDNAERKALASVLLEAASELLDGLQDNAE